MITAVIAVVTILGLMFTSDKEFERREGLFGGVFFESSPTSSGTTSVSAGVDNFVVMGAFFLFFAVSLWFAQGIFSALRERQRALRAAR